MPRPAGRVAPRRDPRTALESVFQTGKKQVDELLDEVGSGGDLQVEVDDEETEDLGARSASADNGDDAPAVKLINLIVLLRALREKASDIHIEPGEQADPRPLPRRRHA